MQLSDGYIDLPSGKIANVVTCLEMLERPQLRTDPPDLACTLHRVENATAEWYRDLFRRIGEPYLWFSRLTLTKEQLEAVIRDRNTEIYAVRLGGRDEGLLELDFSHSDECELVFFGLTEQLVGKGVGRWLMNRAIERAWTRPIRRFHVHTCNLDHPGALEFYIRSGFRPFKRQIEIADDPRIAGVLRLDAAPHVPLI
jgi:GNAT superfamily N-acetyltransferase